MDDTIEYILEYCELPPLNRPEYDSDSDTYDLYFAERVTYNPYNLEQELICIPFETLEEASETLNKVLKIYYETEKEDKTKHEEVSPCLQDA